MVAGQPIHADAQLRPASTPETHNGNGSAEMLAAVRQQVSRADYKETTNNRNTQDEIRNVLQIHKQTGEETEDDAIVQDSQQEKRQDNAFEDQKTPVPASVSPSPSPSPHQSEEPREDPPKDDFLQKINNNLQALANEGEMEDKDEDNPQRHSGEPQEEKTQQDSNKADNTQMEVDSNNTTAASNNNNSNQQMEVDETNKNDDEANKEMTAGEEEEESEENQQENKEDSEKQQGETPLPRRGRGRPKKTDKTPPKP